MACYDDAVEDLEFNPYYKLLQGKFRKKYDIAQEKCYLICIPQTSSIQNANITTDFVDCHIFKPSPILKSYYLSTDKYNSKVIEVEEKEIKPGEGFKVKKRVPILAYEYGYNKNFKQFQILIIKSPLCPVQRTSIKLNKNEVVMKKIRDTVTGLTFAKCRSFLHGNPEHEKIILSLDELLDHFNSSYLVLPSYLTSTASKLKEIIDDVVSDLSIIYHNLVEEDRRILDNIHAIVESYINGYVYEKVFAVISQHMSKADRALSEKLLFLTSVNIAADQLGIKDVFCVQQSAAIVELASLDSLRTPLEKVNCLRTAINLMTDAIVKNISENQLVIKLTMAELPALTTDDLIPILVMVLSQAKLTRLASNLFYIEHFHYSASSIDRTSFNVITFRAAVQYIQSTDFVKMQPAKSQLKKELSLEELMEVTKRLQIQKNEQRESIHDSSTDARTSPVSTIPFSSTDRQLEKITRMIEASTRELREVENLGAKNTRKHERQGSLGGFLTSLQSNVGVSYGKQA